MAGQYAPLARIADPHLRAALKLVLDRLGIVEAAVPNIGQATAPLGQVLDAAGHTVTGVRDPVADDEVVNLRTLRAYLQTLGGSPVPERPAPTPIFTPGMPTPTPTPTPTPDPDPTPNPNPGGPDPSTWPIPQQVTGNIRVAGQTLRAPDGSIYRWRSCTDFRLLKRYLDGEDILPILADRAGEGATMVRVLGMATILFLLDPGSYPNYYSQIGDFADVLAGAGFDVEFVVFADAQTLDNLNEYSEQVNHLNAVRAALLSKPNVVLELVNEYFQNGVEPSSFSRPAGLLSCPSSGDGESPNLPPWDYATFHAPRDSEWPRKSHNAMEVAGFLGRPCINDEPMGAAETAIPGSRSNVPDDFYWFAAVGMLLAGGGTFHSQNGLQSDIWEPVQRMCAAAFFAGIAAIPSEITTGTYTRSHLSDCPIQHTDALALRTYARYNANTAVVVVVRPAGGWVAIPTGAWAITGSTGPAGSVVYLSR